MDTSTVKRLRERWWQTVAPFGAAAGGVDAAFADLAARYGETGRHYHTLEHIAAVLDTLDASGGASAALSLAAWYHDAVYDSRAADNEERSARLARGELLLLSVPSDVIDEAVRLIQLTKTHMAADEDATGQRLLDADLAVLGADPETYDRYAAAVRREYAWVPEADYCAGRRRVLEGFLARPKIYHLLKDAEMPARRNLRREADALGG